MELFRKKGLDLLVSGTSVRTPFFYGTTVASQTIPTLMNYTDEGVHKVRAPACTHTREALLVSRTSALTTNAKPTHAHTAAAGPLPRWPCPGSCAH